MNYIKLQVANGFDEYACVLNHTEDAERLRRLAGMAVVKAQVAVLVDQLSQAVGISTPRVVDIRRVKGGQSTYWRHHEGEVPTIRLRRDPDLHTIVHELAHHWHHEAREKIPYRLRGKYVTHGWDFTWRQDELARLAEEFVNAPLVIDRELIARVVSGES